MYTPYLLIVTMFSGAGEYIDSNPQYSLETCEQQLAVMEASLKEELAIHGILRTKGECRPTTSLKLDAKTGYTNVR